jgi:DNA-binding transcriptional LysR family regulator
LKLLAELIIILKDLLEFQVKTTSSISFEKLRVFFYAAKFSNFSKAARELFVTEGAVSQQIKDLELTDEGKILLGLLDPLIHQFDGLIEDFVDLASSFQGSLKIAATQSIILKLLPQVLKQFEKEHPDIKIIAFNRPPAKVAEMVLSGGADLGVGPLVDIPEGLESKQLIRSSWVLIAPPNHPLSTYKTITPDKIAPFRLILSTRDTGHGSSLATLVKDHNLNLKVAMKVGRWEVIKKYVELGLGIAIIPEICLSDSDRTTIFTRTLDDLLEGLRFGVLTKEKTHISLAAENFIKILIQAYDEKDHQ